MPPRKKPGPHPEPPPDLRLRPLPVRAFDGPWFRIHDLARAPLFFGRTGDNRFDSPHPRKYGVLYVGHDVDSAFIETLGHETGKDVIAEAELRDRGLARVRSRGPLRLVDLTAAGLRKIGADNRLCDGPIAVAQRWSRALHNHPDQPDGLFYRSRHNPARFCAAIFERAGPRVRVTRLGSLLAPPNLRRIAPFLRKYGIRLVP